MDQIMVEVDGSVKLGDDVLQLRLMYAENGIYCTVRCK